MLAVQGPRAREIVQAISDAPLPARMTRRGPAPRAAREVLVCGTGYTGEDGVEILCAPGRRRALWDAARAPRRRARRARRARHAAPGGLLSRSTATTCPSERGPIEAGLGWCCKEDTGFIGAEAVRAVRERGPAEKLVAVRRSTGAGIARQGNPVVGGGEVTSGTFSPSPRRRHRHGLRARRAAPRVGTALEIDVRGKMRRAVVKEKPLYRKGS